MELEVLDANAVEVSDLVFSTSFNEPLIHQVVVAFLAGGRQGSKAQKSRSDTRGGGKKPWKQKGTGRARAGTIRSPLWRSGGKTFAACPKDHSQKVNKKMYQGAMRSIISKLVADNRLMVVEDLVIEKPKTKEMISKLAELKMNSGLIISHEISQNLYLSSRNIPYIHISDVEAVNPVSLISNEKIVITVPALKKLEEMFG